MAGFSKLEIKVRVQSLSSFPSSVRATGLKRTISWESLNVFDFHLAERSLLGCPDASIVWRRPRLNSRRLSFSVSCLQEEGLSSGYVVAAVPQDL